MKRLMAVDDSATVRKVLKSTFSNAGYDVIEAVDGNEAIQKLAEKSVDIIVTDLNMPNMNGVDLITEVRNRPGNRFLPIVMLTSEKQSDMKKAGKSAGASGWITKPFKPENLLSIVKMICPA